MIINFQEQEWIASRNLPFPLPKYLLLIWTASRVQPNFGAERQQVLSNGNGEWMVQLLSREPSKPLLTLRELKIL